MNCYSLRSGARDGKIVSVCGWHFPNNNNPDGTPYERLIDDPAKRFCFQHQYNTETRNQNHADT